MKPATIDGRICRAARGFLNWSTLRLARENDVAVKTIYDLERDRTVPGDAVEKIEDAIRTAGLDMIAEEERIVGIRSREDSRDEA